VLPAEDLVVVITADPNRGFHLDFGAVEGLIDRSIRAAVRAQGPPARRDAAPSGESRDQKEGGSREPPGTT